MAKNIQRARKLLTDDSQARMQASISAERILALVLDAVNGANSPKLSKAVAIGSAAFTAVTALKGFWELYKRSTLPETFVIKITEDDQIYDIVEDWFMDALPEQNQRSVYAHSTVVRKNDDTPRRRRFGADIEYDPDPSEGKVTVDFSFDGTLAQEVVIAGHTVQVYNEIPEGSGKKESKNPWNTRSINLECTSVEARNAVLKEIEDASQHLVESQPKMYVASNYGDWRKRSDIQRRSLGSVVLKEGQMDRIIDYLTDFLKNKEAYIKADIPFRTGILLHGAPGSGKSSTALAIANALKMNVFIVPITSLLNDESLSDCFGAIPANSIVILEDIDIAKGVKSRDEDTDKGVTMQGMLNVLDGFQSPPGVITIMTTNRLDVLNPAIIRPGRVDLTEELGCLDTHQLEGLCEYFMGHVPEGLPTITPEDGITSAEVMGQIRKHLPDFAEAGSDVVDFVSNRVLVGMESANFTE
jgi:chaperone BCS1